MILGKLPRDKHGKVVISVFIIYFAILVISYGFYPGAYSILTHAVSQLGSPVYNPKGWIFFSIAMIFAGITLVPHVLYLFRQMSRKSFHFIDWLFLLTGLIGCAGLITLGLYDMHSEPGHGIATFMSFGSYAASCGLSAIRLLIDINAGKSTMKIWQWLLTFIPMAIVGVVSQIVTYIPEVLGALSETVWFEFFFWEWMGLFSLAIWLLGMYFAIKSS